MDGGWDLVNVWAKSRALFLYRLQAQGQRDGSLTAGWLKKWNLHSRTENLPFQDRIPASLEYLHSCIVDAAYIPRQGGSETAKAYKKRLYTTLQTMHNASSTPQEMRIASLWPQLDWQKIWENLTTAPISEAGKAVWYRTIHDILPTNERLHRIKMSPTDVCEECDKKDTLIHRLNECGEGQPMWEWTRKVTARMLRTIPARIPNEWLLRPQFYLWPPQRQRTVMWVLSRFVTFRLNQQRGPRLHDLMDFLRRSKWKMY